MGIRSCLIPRMATGFCGGMARSGEMCGAVTGGVLAIGLALGRDGLEGTREETYAAVRELLRGFRAAFGSDNCRELLGCDLGTPEGQAFFKEKGLGERCRRFTEAATRLAMELLEGKG